MNANYGKSACRLLVVVVTAFFVASSCLSQEGLKNSRDLTEFATRYAAAWSGQDPIALASFYAENGTLRVNDGEPSVGRDAVAATARSYMAAFPDITIRLVELRQAGDDIEFHWRWTGTNTGPGGTGNAVDLQGYEQWTLDENGLILESLGHFDEAEYQRQLNAGSANSESSP